jgi:cation transport regulator ChaC
MESIWDEEKGVWIGEMALENENLKLPDPLWIFGYGSLCYKNDEIPAEEEIVCKVKGYVRRFF